MLKHWSRWDEDDCRCAADKIKALREAGEAFRVATIESGALNNVSQDKYIDQLRAFEGALAAAR